MKVLVRYHPEWEKPNEYGEVGDPVPGFNTEKIYEAMPVDYRGKQVPLYHEDLTYYGAYSDTGEWWYIHHGVIEVVKEREVKEELLKMKNDL